MSSSNLKTAEAVYIAEVQQANERLGDPVWFHMPALKAPFKSSRRLGLYHTSENAISFNEALLLPENSKTLRLVIRHELAHAACDQYYRHFHPKSPAPADHGGAWRKFARIFGCPARATVPADKIVGLKGARKVQRAFYRVDGLPDPVPVTKNTHRVVQDNNTRVWAVVKRKSYRLDPSNFMFIKEI